MRQEMRQVIDTLHFLNAADAASKAVPSYIRLNYNDLFKIQQVHNPFTLDPVSYSRLAAYLECPGCSLEQRRRKRPKEPKQFTPLRQASLFGRGAPDARLVGTLLHTLVNFLHDARGVLSQEQQENLLADSGALVHFIRCDLLSLLQQAGKLGLAMFFDELATDKRNLHSMVIAPMLLYQRELLSTGAVVLAAAERFQYKLLSTRHTFPGHADWGGHVVLVGEFDQVRLRLLEKADRSSGRLAIMEFKKGLGVKNQLGASPPDLFGGEKHEEEALPSMSHAMQLMVYWMAFQTRWDVFEKVMEVKGNLEEIHMPLEQQVDLIIYNLNDGRQYRLAPTSYPEALSALTNCIFLLNWAMRGGYAWYSPDHQCGKTSLVEMPDSLVMPGNGSISARECYALATEAFAQFKATVRWEVLTRA